MEMVVLLLVQWNQAIPVVERPAHVLNLPLQFAGIAQLKREKAATMATPLIAMVALLLVQLNQVITAQVHRVTVPSVLLLLAASFAEMAQ